jgi:hypothetical protein
VSYANDESIVPGPFFQEVCSILRGPLPFYGVNLTDLWRRASSPTSLDPASWGKTTSHLLASYSDYNRHFVDVDAWVPSGDDRGNTLWIRTNGVLDELPPLYAKQGDVTTVHGPIALAYALRLDDCLLANAEWSSAHTRVAPGSPPCSSFTRTFGLVHPDGWFFLEGHSVRIYCGPDIRHAKQFTSPGSLLDWLSGRSPEFIEKLRAEKYRVHAFETRIVKVEDTGSPLDPDDGIDVPIVAEAVCDPFLTVTSPGGDHDARLD